MKSGMKTYQKFNIAISTLAGVLIALILITGWAVIMRVGNFLPNETDVILLVPKEPSLEVNDGAGTSWETSTDIEIFKVSYTNASGDITVSSLGKDKLIAPGTQNEYKFYVRNNGNVALDFEVVFSATLTYGGLPIDMQDLPIEVRISNQAGNYVVGGENEWVALADIYDTTDLGIIEDYVMDEGIVGKDSYYSYTLEWRWLFESGNDELDTFFGSYAEDKEIVLALNIATHAEQSANAGATGGKNDTALPEQTGGTFRVVAMAVLITVIVCVATALGVLLYKSRKMSGSPNVKSFTGKRKK